VGGVVGGEECGVFGDGKWWMFCGMFFRSFVYLCLGGGSVVVGEGGWVFLFCISGYWRVVVL